MSATALAAPLGELTGPADEFFLSFDEMPHDVPPAGYKDGDDSKLKDTHQNALTEALGSQREPTFPKVTKPPPRKAIVPHPRNLKRGDVGQDVLMLQRALAAAHLRKWGTFTHAFGAGTTKEVKQFQASHDIPASGVYGETTHRKLSPFYDAHGISMLAQYAAQTALQRAQQRMLAAMMVAYNCRFRNHYTQGGMRWMLIANHIHHDSLAAWGSTWADCSSFFTWAYWDIGAPDPNKLDFAGGWTGTLGMHGRVIDPSKAHVGAAFLYGGGVHHHVQLSVGGWNTIGDGGEAGPLYLPGNYRGDLNVVREYPGLSV